MEPQKQTPKQKAEVKLRTAAKGITIPYKNIEYRLDDITPSLKDNIGEANCTIQFNGNARVTKEMESGELQINADVTGKIKIKDYEFAKIESIEIISII